MDIPVWAQILPTGLLLHVKIKPSSNQNALLLPYHVEGKRLFLSVSLTSPPTEGQANKLLCKQLGKWLNLPKTKIKIIKGNKSQFKQVFINGAGKGEIYNLSAKLARLS